MENQEIRVDQNTRKLYIWDREIWMIWREKAINALTNSNIEAIFTNNFIKFMNTYIHNCPNKNQTKTKYWPSQQRFNKRFRIEMYTIWEEFWKEKWSEIIESLNRREKLYDYPYDQEIGININSGDFYRDANYSISIYNKERQKELAIVAFYPKKWKILEIVQIQWKKSEKISRDDLWALIFYIKWLARERWFKKIQILNWDKNYHYRAPWDFPEDWDIKTHQANIKKIYNWYPHRYRGFTKAWERYSEYEL